MNIIIAMLSMVNTPTKQLCVSYKIKIILEYSDTY